MHDDEFEWHDAKAKLNASEHRVTFEVARHAFRDPRFIERLDPDETGEDRLLLTGLAGDVLLTVCYVERGGRKRIISARKASKREQDEYNRANTQAQGGGRLQGGRERDDAGNVGKAQGHDR